MLLILFIIHTLAKKTEAGYSNALGFRSTSDTCDDINNCRRLFDIVWGCLTTIFACTWVSVHPNVPPPYTSWLGLQLRRLKLMLVAVIAPEVMVNFAARQFLDARMFSREFNLSKAHGFFLCMGGFVAENPSTGESHPIVTKEELKHPEYLVAIRKVKAEHIKDKSKGDAFSKGVALAQGIWFVVQCMARFAQRLPVTELEIATLAFAVVNVFVWFLWWNKPLDVQEPISVGPAVKQPPVAIRAVPDSDLGNRFSRILGGIYDNYDPRWSTAVPFFWSASDHDTSKLMRNYPFLTELVVGVIFGAIHGAAWNADFTSFAEKCMWRSSALLVAIIPSLLLPAYAWFDSSIFIEWLFTATLFLGLPTYVIARLFLLILPFTALRALPAGAFIDVNWSVYIPHL